MTYEEIESRKEELDSAVNQAASEYELFNIKRREIDVMASALSDLTQDSLNGFIEDPKKGKHLYKRVVDLYSVRNGKTGIERFFQNILRTFKDLVFTDRINSQVVTQYLNFLKEQGIEINITMQNPNDEEKKQVISEYLDRMQNKDIDMILDKDSLNQKAKNAKELLNLSKANFMNATKLSFKKRQGKPIQLECDKKIEQIQETEGIINYVQYDADISAN